jgi:hypothetical protein
VGGLVSFLGALHQQRTASTLRLMRDEDGTPYVEDVSPSGSSWAFWLIVAGVVLGVAASGWSLLQ